ncbi:hypothetical protein D3C71_1409330 [compost metagenome]
MVTLGAVRGLGAVALIGVDRKEAAVERAFHHARVIHLRQRVVVMPLHDVEVRPGEVGRRIQMRIQGEQLVLQRAGLGQFGLAEFHRRGGQRPTQRQGYQQGQGTQRHETSPWMGRPDLSAVMTQPASDGRHGRESEEHPSPALPFAFGAREGVDSANRWIQRAVPHPRRGPLLPPPLRRRRRGGLGRG